MQLYEIAQVDIEQIFEEKAKEMALHSVKHISGVVPERPLVCIEHPGIVKDTENAINTLGGAFMVQKVRWKCSNWNS